MLALCVQQLLIRFFCFPYFLSSICLGFSSFILFLVPVEFARCYGLAFDACFFCMFGCFFACGFSRVLFSYRVDFVHVGLPYEVFLLFHACWFYFTMDVFFFLTVWLVAYGCFFVVFIASVAEEFLFHACLLCFTSNVVFVVFIFCMLISSAIEEFLFHACLVSFWRSGMLFVFLHVWLVMVVFGWCWSFVAYGCFLGFFISWMFGCLWL